jgi:hypothetical protein
MRKTACTLAIAGLMSATSTAQDATNQAPAPAPKRVTVTTGFDFATAYVFRGIYQEDNGTIAPTYADLGVALGRGVSLNVGTWSSLHSGPSGHGGRGNAWYEADYYGAVTFTLGRLKPGALFTSYTSPNDAFATVHELSGVLAYDDSSSPFPLAPKAVVGFELSGQADGGGGKGRYLELGIRPGLKATAAVTVYIPMKVGISLKDYFEGPTGSNRFGYFDTGLIASVPLGFMNGGTWELHGGVEFLWFGDNMTLLNAGDGSKPVGVLGLSFAY